METARFIAKRVGSMPNWGIWDNLKDEFVVHGFDKYDATWIADTMCQTAKKLGNDHPTKV